MTSPSACLLTTATIALVLTSNLVAAEPTPKNQWIVYTTVQACALAEATSVQADVEGLTAKQGKQLSDLHEQWKTKVKQFSKANRQPTEEQITQLYNDLIADIRKVIKKPQLTRLQQIQFQCEGPARVAVSHPDTAITFGLTKEQHSKIFMIEMKYQQMHAEAALKNLPQIGSQRQTDPPAIIKLRKDRNQEALGAMTQPQRDAWEKLVGEPFAGPLLSAQGKRVHPKLISLP